MRLLDICAQKALVLATVVLLADPFIVASPAAAQSPTDPGKRPVTTQSAATKESPDPFNFGSYVDKGALVRDEGSGSKPAYVKFDPNAGSLDKQREKQQQMEQLRIAATTAGKGENRTNSGAYLLIAMICAAIGAVIWTIVRRAPRES